MNVFSQQVTDWRKSTKARLIEAMGGKCCICGYNKCQRALAFHHTNPSEKDFQISRANIRGWKTLVKEAKKCILVCHNCHNEIHEGITSVPVDTVKFDERYEDYSWMRPATIGETPKQCKHCNMHFHSPIRKSEFCSHMCASQTRRKSERPDHHTLQAEVEAFGYRATGRKYGVSDNAIRKWLKSGVVC